MSLRDIYEAGFDEDDGRTVPQNTCPECDGAVHTEGGETACDDCGLVVDEYRIDHGPDWAWSDDDQVEHERTGAPATPTRHDHGLSSEIGRYRDGQRNVLPGKTRMQFGRLRRLHSRAKYGSKAEQNLIHALSEISRTVAALDLPYSIQERASDLYREAADADLIVGRSIEIMVAGSVYAACRCAGNERSIEEIAEVSTCSVEEVRLGYSVLNREIGLATPTPRVVDAVARLCAAFGVSSEVRTCAVELAALAQENDLTNGRSPSGVAAAALYRAAIGSDEPLTQAAIASEAGTTVATLQARLREFDELDLTGTGSL